MKEEKRGGHPALTGLRWTFLVLACAAVILLLVPEDAEATHYRYATLSWEPGDQQNEVIFTGQFATRWSFFEEQNGELPSLGDVLEMGPLDRGDGGSAPLHIRVDFIDEDDDWLMGPITDPDGNPGIHHTYNGPTRPDGSPWKPFYDHCCRLEETDDENINFHVNNGDPGTDIRLETLVDLSAPHNSSPVTTLDPIQFCPLEAVCTIPVPATDSDEDSLSYRMSSATEAVGGGATFDQPGDPHADHNATIDEDTGVITWNTTGATFDPTFKFTLYSIQVMIEDDETKVPLDFFIRLTPEPELAVEKTAHNVTAGEDAVFQINVTNIGQSTAFGVQIRDDLPTGPDWTHDRPGECTIDAGTLECDLDRLDAGQGFLVHVSASTNPDHCGDLLNEATVTAANLGHEITDSATLRVLCPDLELTKSAQDVTAGENVTFTITLENAGADTIQGANVTDPLPGTLPWELQEPSHPSCAIDENTLECGPVDLDPGETLEATLTAGTTFGDCETLENQAFADAQDLPGTQASAQATIFCPELLIEKTADDPVVTAGENATFTITLTNTGDADATDAGFADPLPGGFPWALVEGADSCVLDEDLLNCGPVDLPPGGFLQATVTSQTFYADCATYTNIASASAANHPETTDSAGLAIECPALDLHKSASETSVNAGENATFTITLTNTGDATATDAGFTDVLPPGLPWELVDPGDPCTLLDRLLTCGGGDLAPGASLSVQVTAQTGFEDCGTHENTATGDASNHPEVTGSAGLTVTCPRLTLEKAPVEGSVAVGQNATFTITLRNTGDSDATEAGLTDLLPPGLPWDLVEEDSHPSCAIDAGVLACGASVLSPGQTLNATVTATTGGSDCGPIENQAEASAANHPSLSASANLSVQCVEISVTKHAPSGLVIAGETLTFEITVSSTGATAATGVEITDVLPPGFDWSHDQPGTCTIVAGTLECLVGPLAPGETFTVLLSAVMTPGSCTTITNQVLVAADDHPDVSASAEVRCVDAQALAQSLYAGAKTPESVQYQTNGVDRRSIGQDEEEVITLDTGALFGGNPLPRVEAHALNEHGRISRGPDGNITAHATTTASETRLLDGAVVLGALHNEARLSYDPTTGNHTLETDHYIARLEVLGQEIPLDTGHPEVPLPGGGHLSLYPEEYVDTGDEVSFRSRIAHLYLPVRIDSDLLGPTGPLGGLVGANATTVEIIIGEVQVRVGDGLEIEGQHREILQPDDAGSGRDATTGNPVPLGTGVYEAAMTPGDFLDVYTVPARDGDLMGIVLKPAVRVGAQGGNVAATDGVALDPPQLQLDRRDHRVRLFDPDGNLLETAHTQLGAAPGVIHLTAQTDGDHRIVVDSPSMSSARNYTLALVIAPPDIGIVSSSHDTAPPDPARPLETVEDRRASATKRSHVEDRYGFPQVSAVLSASQGRS